MNVRTLFRAAGIGLALTLSTPAFAETVDELLARQSAAIYGLMPELATSLGLDEATAGGKYSDRLNDYSPAGFAALTGLAKQFVAEIDAVEKTGLTTAQRTNLDVTRAMLVTLADAGDRGHGTIGGWIGYSPFTVTHMGGPQLDLPDFLDSRHVVSDLSDMQDFMARLRAVEAALDGAVASIQQDADAGVVLPRVLLEKATRLTREFVAGPATENELYATVGRKLDNIEGLPEGDRAIIDARALAVIQNDIYPAYGRLADALEALLPQARDESGIWAQPEGDVLYTELAATHGDTNLTPEQIHGVGLKEVTRIHGEMDAILQSEGYIEGSVGARLATLFEEPRFRYPDTDEGRAQILADLNRYLSDVQARVGDEFRTVPPQAVEIRRVPIYSQETAPGGYYADPPLDGSRPGVFYINLVTTENWPAFSLKTLTYHETIPGHHFQLALGQLNKEAAALRLAGSFNASIEGWALYSEKLAEQMGLYEGDPFGNLGRLRGELFRAIRLVVDTGLHQKRWSRKEAIAYMIENAGWPEGDAIIEIERYMSDPGQALGYKLGMLKYQSLRAKAERTLGDAFDAQAFHDLILQEGPTPLSVLESRVNAWITAQLLGG